MEKVHRLYSPRLNKYLKVRVYLPSGYDGKRRYPVLYMHDGQNLVRPARWSRRSWDVVSTLEKMRLPLIVVGIDSDRERSSTLCPFLPQTKDEEMDRCKDPKGKEYGDFIVEYVKPFIDFAYKTRPDYENTYLAGSSLGGLAAAYLSALHPGVFSCVGVFSLAYWFVEKRFHAFLEANFDEEASYFLAVGGKEGFEGKILDSFDKYRALLSEKGAEFVDKVYPSLWHSEECWAKEFKDFVRLIKARRKEKRRA